MIKAVGNNDFTGTFWKNRVYAHIRLKEQIKCSKTMFQGLYQIRTSDNNNNNNKLIEASNATQITQTFIEITDIIIII